MVFIEHLLWARHSLIGVGVQMCLQGAHSPVRRADIKDINIHKHMTSAMNEKKWVLEETSIGVIWGKRRAQGKSCEEIPYEWRLFS